MTADEIRAEAIERVARALSSMPTTARNREEARKKRANHIIEALGDLLPVRLETTVGVPVVEERICGHWCRERTHFADQSFHRDIVRWQEERRYVTDWIEA